MSCISERVRKVWAREALLQATLLLSVRPRRGGGGGGLSVPCPSTRMWGSWAAPALKGVRAGVGAPAAPRRRAGCPPLGERGGGVSPPPPAHWRCFFGGDPAGRADAPVGLRPLVAALPTGGGMTSSSAAWRRALPRRRQTRQCACNRQRHTPSGQPKPAQCQGQDSSKNNFRVRTPSRQGESARVVGKRNSSRQWATRIRGRKDGKARRTCKLLAVGW